MIFIIRKPEIVFVGVHYYLPDYTHIIQTFHWQTDDLIPELPRVHKFLSFWKNNINAVIKEVEVSSSQNKIRLAGEVYDHWSHQSTNQ